MKIRSGNGGDAIRPQHYLAHGIEPIAVINSWDLNFNLGNVIKYVARMGRKKGHPAIEDLRKARQYLDFEIERVEQNASHSHSAAVRAPEVPANAATAEDAANAPR